MILLLMPVVIAINITGFSSIIIVIIKIIIISSIVIVIIKIIFQVNTPILLS